MAPTASARADPQLRKPRRLLVLVSSPGSVAARSLRGTSLRSNLQPTPHGRCLVGRTTLPCHWKPPGAASGRSHGGAESPSPRQGGMNRRTARARLRPDSPQRRAERRLQGVLAFHPVQAYDEPLPSDPMCASPAPAECMHARRSEKTASHRWQLASGRLRCPPILPSCSTRWQQGP